MSETLSSHAQEAFSNELCSLASLSDPFHQSSGSVISEELEALPWANISILASDLLPALTWASVAPRESPVSPRHLVSSPNCLDTHHGDGASGWSQEG